MIYKWQEENSAKIIVEEIPYLRSAGIGVYIKVGSRHEPLELKGASHFLEHMLFKGTEKRTAREIAESFEEIGGQLNAFTSKEYTGIYARTLDEHIYMAIEIIFDMLFNSSINLKDINTEREVILEEINMYEDTPDELIHDLFAQKFWTGHPMGSPILGTPESLNEISRDDLYDYYKTYYNPSNMVIVVAGNVNALKIKEDIMKYLLNKKSIAVLADTVESIEQSAFIDFLPKTTEQVQICLGVPGISFHHQDRHTQMIMNSIFGGGLSSRLFQSIREELGLAYSVYSYPATYSDTGSFCIYAGTSPGKISTFFEALDTEIQKFITQGISEDELSRTKQLLKSSIYLGLESVMNRINRIAKSELIYNEIISPDQVIESIYKVEKEKVQEFAEGLLKKDLFSLVAIGSKEIEEEVSDEFNKRWRQ